MAFFILFILSFFTGKGQNYEELLKAMSASGENRQFQQTINYLQKIIAIDTVRERRSFRYWQIASLYDSLDNKEQSKAYCRLSITDGKFDHSYSKRRYAIRLADQFIDEKKYDSALYYLKYAKSVPSIRNMCGSNNIESRTEFYYRFMLAYEGLNETDSAINSFLPYAFQEWTDLYGAECSTQHLFEGDYHCQLLDFLRVLGKKYSQSEIIGEVNNLIGHVFIKARKESNSYGCSFDCDFGVTFFGHELALDFFGISCPADAAKETGEISFYKELFIRDLAHSLIYLLNSSANYI